MIFSIIFILFCCAGKVFSQNTVSESASSVSSGINSFATELLAKTANEGGQQTNLIMSSYSIWNLLAILSEGAQSSTLRQLLSSLRIPRDNNVFKVGYKAVSSSVTNSPGVEINVANAIFTDMKKQLLKDFQYQTSTQYKVNFVPVNFANVVQTTRYIDSYIANATNNRVKNIINYDDLINAQLLLTTAIYFRGQWTMPFNRSATKTEEFYDENMNVLGNVDLMYQAASFPYAMFENLQAHAVEIPYGEDEKFSMIIVLPMQTVPLNVLLNRLTKINIETIYDALQEDKQNNFGEIAEVWLPRFKISSDFILNVVLEKMGILDVFNPQFADLYKMSRDHFYLSRFIHKAEIEVNEEGTVAAAGSAGTISYKQPPPQFKANRPFAYFIIEKTTKTILFAGKASNPNNFK